ncbi:hypothetical protein DW355_09770 [Hylemonella gracilis]|uniref:Uncharacterized protein n=1 Tax=Hylemonella gracilis TaxID=80880 RepID=A0A4P6UI69_9BURK|nr:hypothetical protein DW355_09770 [Hylemonella gracilis]
MQQPSIRLESHGSIRGVLHYAFGGERYSISYEHTGDYQTGILVFIRDLDAQLQCEEPLKRRSQILRDLQEWSKKTGERLTW